MEPPDARMQWKKAGLSLTSLVVQADGTKPQLCPGLKRKLTPNGALQALIV